MASSPIPTVDELVGSLQRSFIPTILIEGVEDVFIYRYLKSNLNLSPVSLQPCGGRPNLFRIHDRKAEFHDKNVIFVADKDSYRFEDIPERRSDIIFTSGYSIENDIYHGSNINTMLDEEDREQYELLRVIVAKWFTFELNRYLNCAEVPSMRVSPHINVIVPRGTDNICPIFSREIEYTDPCPEELNIVVQEYDLNVRGKQLFQMLGRFMSKKGRYSSFSERNLIEVALKQGANTNLERLTADINNHLVE